jgi:hypothetical protein
MPFDRASAEEQLARDLTVSYAEDDEGESRFNCLSLNARWFVKPSSGEHRKAPRRQVCGRLHGMWLRRSAASRILGRTPGDVAAFRMARRVPAHIRIRASTLIMAHHEPSLRSAQRVGGGRHSEKATKRDNVPQALPQSATQRTT